MTYRRVISTTDLPPAGPLSAVSRERGDLDFKRRADPAKSWEHAKDIAAFANALGGVLLIGADDSTDVLRYSGIEGQTVKDIQTIYEQAAQCCSPCPVVDVVPLVANSHEQLVAVNVDPYFDQPIAAPARTRDRQGAERKHDTAWVYPIRRASQTDRIKPENLAMYMNKEVRRIVLLLAKVPKGPGTKVSVSFHVRFNHPTHITHEVLTWPLTIDSINLECNFVTLSRANTFHTSLRVPLTDVMDAWQEGPHGWHILLRGQVSEHPAEKGGVKLEYRLNSRL